MISQLFVLAPNGHTIVHKDYRGDVPKEAPEIFLRKIVEKKDDPVFQVDGVNYICVRKNGLFFMCTTVYSCTSYHLRSNTTRHNSRVFSHLCLVLAIVL